MMRASRWWLLVIILALPGVAGAQAASPGRLEVSVGAGLLGGGVLGDAAANLRAGGSGDPFQLFDATSDLSRSGVVEVRVGYALFRRVSVEVRAAVDRPEWRTRVSADFEGASDATLVERLTEYTIDGGVRVSLEPVRLAGLTPFASGGAGYLRQLHEENTLIEERSVAYVGGGLSRSLHVRQSGLLRSVGIRVDARLNLIGGGGSFGDDVRRQGALTAGVSLGF